MDNNTRAERHLTKRAQNVVTLLNLAVDNPKFEDGWVSHRAIVAHFMKQGSGESTVKRAIRNAELEGHIENRLRRDSNGNSKEARVPPALRVTPNYDATERARKNRISWARQGKAPRIAAGLVAMMDVLEDGNWHSYNEIRAAICATGLVERTSRTIIADAANYEPAAIQRRPGCFANAAFEARRPPKPEFVAPQHCPACGLPDTNHPAPVVPQDRSHTHTRPQLTSEAT